MRGVMEPAFVPVAEQQRAERLTRALALRITADDKVGALCRLHLEPAGRALAGVIAAVLALADHALEAARERRMVQRDAVFRRVHQLHERRRQKALREIPAPI